MSPQTENEMASVVLHCSAWVDTRGKFHPVSECGHRAWAMENHDCDPRKLEEMGWMHVSHGSVHDCGHKPNQAQLDTLFDFVLIADRHPDSCYAETLRDSVMFAINNS
jgi:hypothetical protein